MLRFCVFIPYRDRANHLAELLPRLTQTLQQDPRMTGVLSRVVIVEQNDDQPFNRGALFNAGFLVEEESFDYVCFHDVDFVPIDVDYSMPELPTRRIWEGAQSRPREPGGDRVIRHRFNWFFGAVLVFRKEHFRRVNGFDNHFPGWGFEDGDLRERCRYEGLEPQFGHGHFEALDHVNRGVNPDLSYTEQAMTNRRRYHRRWADGAGPPDHQSDGLSSIVFDWTETRSLLDELFGAESYPNARHLLVNLRE